MGVRMESDKVLKILKQLNEITGLSIFIKPKNGNSEVYINKERYEIEKKSLYFFLAAFLTGFNNGMACAKKIYNMEGIC